MPRYFEAVPWEQLYDVCRFVTAAYYTLVLEFTSLVSGRMSAKYNSEADYGTILSRLIRRGRGRGADLQHYRMLNIIAFVYSHFEPFDHISPQRHGHRDGGASRQTGQEDLGCAHIDICPCDKQHLTPTARRKIPAHPSLEAVPDSRLRHPRLRSILPLTSPPPIPRDHQTRAPTDASKSNR